MTPKKGMDKIDKQKKRKEVFLTELVKHGTVSYACRLTVIPRSTIYLWRSNDEEFKVAMDEAEEAGVDALIDEARRRAAEGVDEPVFYQGKQATDENGKPLRIRKYSDTLLMFLIKAKRPEYRDKGQVEMIQPAGGFDLNIITLSPEERRARINALIAKRGDGASSAPGTGSEG